jgi:hypothetical protein
MKIPCIALVALIFTTAFSFAGPASAHFRSDKKAVVPRAEELYRAREIQIDVFAAYGVGRVDARDGTEVIPPPLTAPNLPARIADFTRHADHGWGGGIGLNYFFTRNWGVGAEGYWLDADTTVHAVLGDLIYRYPFEFDCKDGKRWGLAPYGMLSGGGQFDGRAAGLFGLGGGLEARWCPEGAVFTDGRWILHDKDVNYGLFRMGVRFIF